MPDLNFDIAALQSEQEDERPTYSGNIASLATLKSSHDDWGLTPGGYDVSVYHEYPPHSLEHIVDGSMTTNWVAYYGGDGSWIKMSWPHSVPINQIVFHGSRNLPWEYDEITSSKITFSDGSVVMVGPIAYEATVTITFPTKFINSFEWKVLNSSGPDLALCGIEVWVDESFVVPAPTHTFSLVANKDPVNVIKKIECPLIMGGSLWSRKSYATYAQVDAGVSYIVSAPDYTFRVSHSFGTYNGLIGIHQALGILDTTNLKTNMYIHRVRFKVATENDRRYLNPTYQIVTIEMRRFDWTSPVSFASWRPGSTHLGLPLLSAYHQPSPMQETQRYLNYYPWIVDQNNMRTHLVRNGQTKVIFVLGQQRLPNGGLAGNPGDSGSSSWISGMFTEAPEYYFPEYTWWKPKLEVFYSDV